MNNPKHERFVELFPDVDLDSLFNNHELLNWCVDQHYPELHDGQSTPDLSKFYDAHAQDFAVEVVTNVNALLDDLSARADDYFAENPGEELTYVSSVQQIMKAEDVVMTYKSLPLNTDENVQLLIADYEQWKQA